MTSPTSCGNIRLIGTPSLVTAACCTAVVLVLFSTMIVRSSPSAQEGPQIKIDAAWAQPLPQVVTSAEFYMVIRNGGSAPDRLRGGRSPQCGMLDLYETYTTPQGAMGMRPVPGGTVEVPAKGRLELKPGGLHIMCMEKKGDFKPGLQFPLTLEFEKSGEKAAMVTIRDQGPMMR